MRMRGLAGFKQASKDEGKDWDERRKRAGGEEDHFSEIVLLCKKKWQVCTRLVVVPYGCQYTASPGLQIWRSGQGEMR